MSTSQKPRVDEEEDLDDLDDVLDQFSSPPGPTSQTKPSTPPAPQPGAASSSKSPQKALDGAGDELADEFAAELAREMESMFKGLGIDPQGIADATPSGPETVAQKADREKLAAAWEAMLVESMDAAMVDQEASGRAGGSSASPQSKQTDDFQSRIRSTMNKLKESESGLKSSGSSAPGADSFEALLSRLGGLEGLSGEGEEGEGQLEGVLEAMIGQLMGKDMLYEPLKELHDKFPGYLTEHSSTISPEDKKRYEAQIACIKQLLVEFEAKEYRDEDEGTRERIVELMGELQTHGSPPEEIMGPLPPGFSMGADGLPNLPPEPPKVKATWRRSGTRDR